MNTVTTLHPMSRALPNRPLGPMRSPARALGWFSIGLGLAELAMPRRLARIAGAPNLPTMTRIFGLREIGTGIGILTSKDPSPWLWGRVAGDAAPEPGRRILGGQDADAGADLAQAEDARHRRQVGRAGDAREPPRHGELGEPEADAEPAEGAGGRPHRAQGAVG